MVDLGEGVFASELFSGAVAHHTCALLEDGRLKCWGGNSSGQLGLEDDEPRRDEYGEIGFRLDWVLL